MNPALGTSITTIAKRLGIDPVDLATVISYETGGTFDDWQKGPTTQWGEHRGLIQMGEPQRQKYGYTQDAPIDQKMDAIGRYLIDTGVRPGATREDIYSAINAGGVGRANRTDAHNGGAPGTVRDKVFTMGPHALKAMNLLGMTKNPMSGFGGMSGVGTTMGMGMPGMSPQAAAKSELNNPLQAVGRGTGLIGRLQGMLGNEKGMDKLGGVLEQLKGGDAAASEGVKLQPSSIGADGQSAQIASSAAQMMAQLLAAQRGRGMMMGG